jgi:FAD/FMN-containing dehydrogenase
VRAIELVTAEGEARTVDAENDPDLFWALRGGGGNFALVVALHIDLVPVADAYAGIMIFPAAVGAAAVRHWRDWAATLDENVTSVVRFLRPPDIPDVPEPLRGTPLLTIDGACIGSREEGEAAFAPLLEIGEPMMNSFDQVPPAALCRIHMDPEQPVPGLGHHRVLRELPDAAIDAFSSMADADSGTPLLLTEIRQMGGALSRPAENGGALSHLDAEFAMFGIGMPMTPELGQAIEGHLDALHEAMEPWAADGGYFNFAERPCDADAILPPEVCARLAEIKRQYDPDSRIIGSHAVSLDPAV